MSLRRCPVVHVVLLAVALVALRTPAPASAGELATAPAVKDARVTAWLGNAQRVWNAAPACPGGVRVIRAQWLDDPAVWAAAEQPGCTIALDPDFYPAPARADRATWESQMCSVLAHEWGHLLGQAHSTDSRSLMYPSVDTVRGCAPAAPKAAPAEHAAPARARARARPCGRRAAARSARRRAKRSHARTCRAPRRGADSGARDR
jgi:hypothetical protein